MKKRLVRQIYASYLILILISLAAVSWYASRSLSQFYIERTKADLVERSRLFYGRIYELIDSVDSGSIDRVCKEIGQTSDTRLTVLLANGRVIGDSAEDPAKMDSHADRPEIMTASAGQTSTMVRYSRTLNQRMMYAAIPLKHGNQVKAIIRISVPLKPIDDELASIRRHIFQTGVLIAILASGICFWVSRRITAPIEHIKQGVAHFAAGDFKHKLHVAENVEMAELAYVMNDMAAQLEDRICIVIRQRNEIEAILSSMIEGVIALDNDEKIIKINRAAALMFDLDEASAIGMSIQEAVRKQSLHEFIRAAFNGDEKREMDFVMHRKSDRIINVRCTRLRDAENLGIGILLVINDVTRLRWLETVRKEFAANVSHEIKTPLTAIKSSVETLRQGALNAPDEADRFLVIVDKHVNRLTAIIDDLLYLSRIEREDELKRINTEKYSLKEVLSAAAQVCRMEAEAKQIALSIECDPLMQADIDPLMMEQAVVNLLDNAIKYSETGNKILLIGAKTGQDILLQVQDWGIGIAAEHLPRLFERFYRVDKARSRKLGGTGLGLAIVKHIVRAHRGDISVESAPGQGSTFTIRLPA